MDQTGEHDAKHHHDMTDVERELWDAVWHLRAQYDHLSAVIKENRMATQQEIDDLTTALTADDAAIQQEIAALQAANPQLNLDGLKAAVAATAALVPAPAPAPAPAPVDPTPAPAPTPDPNPAPPAA